VRYVQQRLNGAGLEYVRRFQRGGEGERCRPAGVWISRFEIRLRQKIQQKRYGERRLVLGAQARRRSDFRRVESQRARRQTASLLRGHRADDD